MIAEEDIEVGAVVRLDTLDGRGGEDDAIIGECCRVVEDIESEFYFSGETVGICAVKYNPKDFTFVSYNAEKLPLSKTMYDIADTITPQDIDPPSIARPVLAERKVGKVPIELVDTGFPNALWELAKVLGWAAEHKGYKMNDWKNLPNAKTAFQAAASRHRMKPLLGEEFDPESGLHHKVHELFNVAAELELILTGKIK